VSLVGVGLRLFAVDSQSFWYDEAATAQMVESPYADLLSGLARDNGNPPAYWVCAKAWTGAFGRSEIGFRSFSIFCGALAIPLVGILGHRLLGPAEGLLAATLFAISPLQVELSNEARTYALLHLLAVANTWVFVRWVWERRRADWILYVATTALGWYSHYYFPALQLAQGTSLLALRRPRELLAPWLASMIAALLLWAPWIPVFVEQIRTPGNLERVSKGGWAIQFLVTPVSFGVGRSFVWRDDPRWLFGVATLAILATLFLPTIRWAWRTPESRFAAVLLCGSFIIPVLGPLAAAFMGKPVYSHRYASVGLPAFLLAAAHGLIRLRPSTRSILISLLVTLTTISLFRYAIWPLKDDWRSASQSILAGMNGGEVLLFDDPIEIATFRYYATGHPRIPVGIIALHPGATAERLLRGKAHLRGIRADREDRDYAPEVAAAPGLWLALCAPIAPPERYESRLGELGFKLVGRRFFHRVALYHFRKS
jgi:4-amino-4-deoxy-L-arabinose transferase-like glycosyltransferase